MRILEKKLKESIGNEIMDHILFWGILAGICLLIIIVSIYFYCKFKRTPQEVKDDEIMYDETVLDTTEQVEQYRRII